MKKRWLLTSAILHLIPLLFIFGSGGDGEGKGIGSSRFDGVELVDVIPKSKSEEISKNDPNPEIIIPKVKHNIEEECPGSWYGGIGIMGDSPIERVFSGYPADLAGLLVGDVILSVSDEQIRGEPGTVIYMSISRNGVTMNFTITRGKVCY